MRAAPDWQEFSPPLPAVPALPRQALGDPLPPPVEAAVWRGSELGASNFPALTTGFDELDSELPGHGWPCRSVTELLQAQPAVLEWRLLGPSLQRVVSAGRHIVVVGPPRHPHLPGLRHSGLDERLLIWIRADTPAERLWCTEQLIKSNAFGALLAWLPQARPEQIRRLQVCAQACEGLAFLCRPESTRRESSAAPLRVLTGFGADWELRVQILKRRGPAHEGEIRLPSVPGGLQSVLTPRLQKPTRRPVSPEVAANVVGSAVAPLRARRHAAAR